MTPLVPDASAGVDLLLRNEAGVMVRQRVAGAELHMVAHLDAEVFSALARPCRSGSLSAETVSARLRLRSSLDVTRTSISGAWRRCPWQGR